MSEIKKSALLNIRSLRAFTRDEFTLQEVEELLEKLTIVVEERKEIEEKELAEINMVLAQTRAESNLNFGIAMSFLGGLFLLGGLFAYNRLKTKERRWENKTSRRNS